VYLDGRYDLVVAEDVSRAIRHLQRREFDAIIVDIRLPPGDDSAWIQLYRKSGADKVAARLGLRMLATILNSPDAEVTRDGNLSWITPERIGVLTVESYNEVKEKLEAYGIQQSQFRQKRADAPETLLLDIIESVLEKQEMVANEEQENDGCSR